MLCNSLLLRSEMNFVFVFDLCSSKNQSFIITHICLLLQPDVTSVWHQSRVLFSLNMKNMAPGIPFLRQHLRHYNNDGVLVNTDANSTMIRSQCTMFLFGLYLRVSHIKPTLFHLLSQQADKYIHHFPPCWLGSVRCICFTLTPSHGISQLCSGTELVVREDSLILTPA